MCIKWMEIDLLFPYIYGSAINNTRIKSLILVIVYVIHLLYS
jgi:hypothetical protein